MKKIITTCAIAVASLGVSAGYTQASTYPPADDTAYPAYPAYPADTTTTTSPTELPVTGTDDTSTTSSTSSTTTTTTGSTSPLPTTGAGIAGMIALATGVVLLGGTLVTIARRRHIL